VEVGGRARCLSSDLSRYGAEEMARQFLQAEDLLEGLEFAAEQAVGFGAYLVFGEAKKHAAKARKIAEGHARKEEAN
jgi:nucleoside-diphosphate-sugar epimerase